MSNVFLQHIKTAIRKGTATASNCYFKIMGSLYIINQMSVIVLPVTNSKDFVFAQDKCHWSPRWSKKDTNFNKHNNKNCWWSVQLHCPQVKAQMCPGYFGSCQVRVQDWTPSKHGRAQRARQSKQQLVQQKYSSCLQQSKGSWKELSIS